MDKTKRYKIIKVPIYDGHAQLEPATLLAECDTMEEANKIGCKYRDEYQNEWVTIEILEAEVVTVYNRYKMYANGSVEYKPHIKYDFDIANLFEGETK